MNRIDAIFRALRARGAKALMPFVTAGDPDLTTTELLPHERFRASSFFRHLAFGIRRRSKNWPLNP